MRTSFHRFAAFTVAALWAGSAVHGFADEGFARLSDGTAAAPAPLGLEPGVCGAAGCPGGPCGAHGHCGHECHVGHKCRWCLFGHGRCPGPHDHCCPLTAMLCHDGSCTHSPDHGWVRPRKFPVHRVPVTYQYYWPARWYGQPGSGFVSAYPMVYMPTDTTELGFYYQRVPYWIPKPVMLPPGPPWPPQWHRRDCVTYGYDISPTIGAPGTYGGGFAAADGMLLTADPAGETFPAAASLLRPTDVEPAAFGQ